jgi:hypothetical protein
MRGAGPPAAARPRGAERGAGPPRRGQDGGAPERFIVALAILSLLAGAAEVQPLVCLVDDVQWLDRASAQTLAFVARRLLRSGSPARASGRSTSRRGSRRSGRKRRDDRIPMIVRGPA